MKDCWVDDKWDRDMLTNLIDARDVNDIISEIPGRRLGQDILIWHLCVDGSFSTKMAWEVTCTKQPQFEGLD